MKETIQTISSHFDKQAKWVGWGFGALLLYLAGKYILPILLTIVWQGIALVIGLAVLALFVAILSDARARKAIFYSYRNITRALTRLMVKTDPVGIMEGYKEDMEEATRTMEKKKGVLEGAKEKLLRFIENRREKMQRQLDLARGAKATGDKAQQGVYVKYAEGLEKSIQKGEALLAKIDMFITVLSKWLRMVDLRYQEVCNNIELISTERSVVRTVFAAFKSAWELLKGGVDKQLYDMATEEIMNDITMKMGQMKGFLDGTDQLFRDFDLEQAMYAADADEKLDAMMERVNALADKAEEVNLIEPATAASAISTVSTSESALRKLARRNR